MTSSMQSPDSPARYVGSIEVGSIEPVVLNPRWAKLGQVNAILNGKNTFHYAENYRGTLSIKCLMSGQAVYEVEGGRFAVNESSYLVLNNQQTYTLTIDADTVVETFCLFFRPGFAEGILHNLVTPADCLLDDPLKSDSQPVLFFERLYPHDDLLLPIILALRAATQDGSATPGWIDEQFHTLLERLLYTHRGIRREVETMPALRAATRAEIYRRLYRARDFIDATLDQPLTLDHIAEVAWLSPHHFLRLFKQVFAITPHQYLTRKRIEEAQGLLLASDKPILDICLETGLTSHSAFSRLFRHHVGVSPETFRRLRGVCPQNSNFGTTPPR